MKPLLGLLMGWTLILGCLADLPSITSAHAAACLPDIAYTADSTTPDPSGLTTYDLMVRTNCGQTTKRLFTRDVTFVSWFPSGRYLLASLAEVVDGLRATHLYKVDISTGEATRITNLPESEDAAAVSPDGTEVAFYYGRDERPPNAVLNVINLSTSEVRTVATIPCEVTGSDIHWSPGGKQIAFWTETGSRCDITAVGLAGADGSSSAVVAQSPSSTTWLRDFNYTPDGAYLVAGYEISDGGWTLDAYRLQDGTTTELTKSATGGPSQVSISNDWVMYYGDQQGPSGPGVYSRSLGNPNQISLVRVQASIREVALYDTSPVTAPPTGFPGGVGQPTPPPTPTPANQVWAGGDSYTSGEGAPDPTLGYQVGTDQPDNRCHRSSRAYPVLIAKKLKVGLELHACSGAVVRDYAEPYAKVHNGDNPGELAQRDTISKQDKIGFITLGGNNIDFATVLAYCAVRARYQPTCEQTYGKHVDRLLTQVEHSNVFTKLYKDILSRMAPGAKLYVIGYPRFFPVRPPGTCWTGAPFLQGSTFIRSDMVWINNGISRLDVALMIAAAKVSGVKFVDVYDVFNGHELCNTSKNAVWMNRAILSTDKHVIAGSFHPNVKGQKAEAEWIVRRMG